MKIGVISPQDWGLAIASTSGEEPIIGLGASPSELERRIHAVYRALRYSLSIQIQPGSDQPYADNPNVKWDFWSWMPDYDYTVSGDQATHPIRGLLFALDYLSEHS